MKIGARTIKTGLVVALTIFLVNLMETKINIVEYNIAGMAAITAINGMQPSIKGSLETFKNRIIATFIGSIVAFLLAYTLGINAFWLGLGSIIIILICIKLEQEESIRFALITLLAVSTYNNSFHIMDVVYRVSGMLIGIIVSTSLNVLFMPPDYTEDLKTKINELREKFEKLFENAINDILREEKIEKEIIKDKRQIIRDELDDTRDIYSLLIEDVMPKNKRTLKKYRRSINAIQSNLERLMALHRSIVFMPNDPQYTEIRKELFIYLKYLLMLHRQIYNQIVLNINYQDIEKNINKEELRKKIVLLVKANNDEDAFEIYNVYFEATRINEKLEQLKDEFQLDF